MMNLFALLWELIKKNFKLLIRSKTSALIVILGPLFIIFLVGVAFSSTGLHSVRVGVYSEEYNNLTNSLIDLIEDNDFIVWKYESESACVESLKINLVHICVIFPPNMNLNMSVQKQVKFHVDYSKVNLVFMILSAVMGEFEDKSSDIRLEYTEILIDKLNETVKEIRDNRETLVTIMADGDDINLKVNSMYEDVSEMELDFNISQIQETVSSNRKRIDEFILKLDAAYLKLLKTTDMVREQKEEAEEMIDNIVEQLEEDKLGLEKDLAKAQETWEECECGADSNCEGDKETDLETCVSAYSAADQLPVIIGMIDEYIYEVEASKGELGFGEGLFEIVTLQGDVRYMKDLLLRSKAEFNTTQKLVDDAEEKVHSAELTRNSTIEELASVKGTLESSLDRMENITGVLDEIDENLKNVTVVSPAAIVNPLQTKIEPLLKEKTYLDYTFPSLLVLIIMFISILLSSTAVMTERNSKAYFRNFITPVLDDLFLFGAYISNLVIVSIQVLIIAGVGVMFFGIHILPAVGGASLLQIILNLLAAVFVISTIFVLLGMVVGYFFNSEETVTLASISISSILMLFSSIVIPIETMAIKIGRLAQYNPFVIGSEILQKLLLHQTGLVAVKRELIILACYIIYLVLLLHYVQLLSKEKLQ